MTKEIALNKVIAIVSGKKSRVEKTLTAAHRLPEAAISGISRTYQPVDEEGEKLPAENRRVQKNVKNVVSGVMEDLSDFFNLVATQESGNCFAKADVVVNEKILLDQVPVTVLLFLERRLHDLHTFVAKLPVLPADREWNFDENLGCFVTAPEQTARTQKVQSPIVLYDATAEHPAQTQLISTDKTVGHWTTRHFSGALPAQERGEMLERVELLQDAVKSAREEANSLAVEQKEIGDKVLCFIFNN